MSALKRWTSSVVASFDWMISQVENHEALVNSAITEAQSAAARAKARLARVKTDGQTMRKKLIELREQEVLWEERAVKVFGADQKKALECLRRKKRVLTQIAELEGAERSHSQTEKQLEADPTAIDARLGELKQQRNLMRTRQSRAEAIKAVRASESNTLCEIDEIFERWEARVTEYEMQGGMSKPSDELESEFVSEEEQHELQAEMERVLERQAAGASPGAAK